ncbi:MAG TPA: hypothetical protein VGO61_16735, partial [Steroidobacteraceae bacterium]|nr:hypothetical protein [Steroidobacteraceae bacterium]
MKTRDFPRSQKIGTAWTAVYAVLTAIGPTAFRNSDFESVLVVFVLPIACLLAVFAYFRNGKYIAFGTLTLATLTLSIPFGLVEHMPDLPTLYSMLALLIGAPLALARSLWLTYR